MHRHSDRLHKHVTGSEHASRFCSRICSYIPLANSPKSLEWINEDIRLSQRNEIILNLWDMYRYISLFLMSNLTGLSVKKTLFTMMKMGLNVPSVELVLLIVTGIRAFSSTLHRGESGTLHSQRDQTHHLFQLEQLSFRSSNRMFLVQLHQCITVDDDMMGKSDGNNQVRSISSIKAAHEAHIADLSHTPSFPSLLRSAFGFEGESSLLQSESSFIAYLIV